MHSECKLGKRETVKEVGIPVRVKIVKKGRKKRNPELEHRNSRGGSKMGKSPQIS
jgi:hypothetical protein